MSKRSPFLDFFDVQTSFYKPMWIRVSLTLVCGVWGLMELSRGATFWAALFLGLGVYLGYQFFVVFDPHDDTDDDASGS